MTPGGMGGSTYVFNFPNYVGSQEDLKRMINEARDWTSSAGVTSGVRHGHPSV